MLALMPVRPHFRKCRAAAAKKCNDLHDPYFEEQCLDRETDACGKPAWNCSVACYELDPLIPGNCQGEVRAQKCPFNCQRWNPVSKSCDGTPSNGCK